jgi:hypothetical protein
MMLRSGFLNRWSGVRLSPGPPSFSNKRKGLSLPPILGVGI